MKKRFLDRAAAFVVAFVMMVGGVSALPEECFSLIGSVVRAEEAVASGKCGDNVFWELDSKGVFTVSGTGGMDSYDYNDSMPWGRLRSQIKKIVINDGVTYLGMNAFYGCVNLKELSLTETITGYGYEVFGGCSGLESVFVPKGAGLGAHMFEGCTSLKYVTLSEGIIEIPNSCFARCSSLKSIEIPKSVWSLQSFAFFECTSLEKLIIKGCISYISELGNGVFYEDSKLTIYGHSDRYIEEYTDKYNIPFVALDYVGTEATYNGHKYKLFDESMTWDEAKAYCENLGGHLVTINSAYEQTFITSLTNISSKKNIWLGSELVNENYVWITNEDFSYTNWASGEPNDVFGMQNSIMMYTRNGNDTAGTWNDESKEGRNWSGYRVSETGFVCEWDSISDIGKDKKDYSSEIDFINQHIISSNLYDVYLNDEIGHETLTTMNCYEDSVVEKCHAIASGIDFTVKAVTIDYKGVIKTISANDYNKILLDMYYDIEVNDDKLLKKIYNNSIQSAIENATDPLISYIKQSCSDETNWEKFNEAEFELDCQKWVENNGKLKNEVLFSLMEKHGLEYKDEKNSKGKIETKLKETPADDAFGPVNKFLGGLGTAYEAINNIKEIMCASVIAGMNDEYIDMLIKIRDKAQNIEGHGFEKTDLINALNFEIDYKEWYGSTITFQQGFEIYDELTSTTDLEQYGANALSRKIWEHTGEELIIKTFSNPEKILTQFSSAQLAAKVGWGIADKAFDLSNKNNLYYKAKCYGVLEEILLDILEEEKNNLPSEFVSASMDGKKIEKYHSIASQYDLAFKMYKYVEGKGCKTYADYEKAFMMTEKSDNIVDRVFQLFGNGAETVVRLLINRPDPYTTIYDLLTGKGYESSLEKTYAELLKNEINRLYNSLYYTSRAKSVEKWVCCGDVFSIEANTNGNKLGSEYVKILFDTLVELS